VRHVLERKQWVDASIRRTFELFSDALMLELITPSWLGFRVITPAPIEISAGTLLDYRLRLHGVPVRWRTRIDAWDPPYRFVDVQLRGPYRYWHHTHTFETASAGTRIGDRVVYELPHGRLGELAHRILVRGDLERIFDHRERAIAGLLADDGARPAS
jgi:ligand-binding SRPBCC domain-containing protein